MVGWLWMEEMQREMSCSRLVPWAEVGIGGFSFFSEESYKIQGPILGCGVANLIVGCLEARQKTWMGGEFRDGQVSYGRVSRDICGGGYSWIFSLYLPIRNRTVLICIES